MAAFPQPPEQPKIHAAHLPLWLHPPRSLRPRPHHRVWRQDQRDRTSDVSTRTDTIETQPLNLQGEVAGVSSTSEMVVVLPQPGHDFDPVWAPIGLLARVPLGGGATRELLDDVLDADWNPDGSDLAIARRVNGQFSLEYPPGKVLYQTRGYISDLRFSPSGQQIAFLDHPIFGDDRGTVSLIDLQGRRKVLTKEFASEQGLAWSPRADEIWFTSALASEPSALHAVNLAGKEHVVLSAPIRLQLQDVVPDGRVLLATQYMRLQVGVVDTANSTTHDLTVFQWMELEDISRDGSMILLNSFDTGSDSNYRLYVQRTDGSAPVLVGEGAGSSFSFDGKYVTAQDPTDPTKLSIIPTGVGETRTLRAPDNMQYLGSALLPGNQRILITAADSKGSVGTYIQEIANGTVHAVAQGKHVEAFAGILEPGPSPDGKNCILVDGEARHWLQPLDGSVAREIPKLDPGEKILNWHNDSSNLFVSRPDGADIQIYSVNLTTGERKLSNRFSPADKTGMASPSFLFITPDGSRYAYSTLRIFSTLFQVDGLR